MKVKLFFAILTLLLITFIYFRISFAQENIQLQTVYAIKAMIFKNNTVKLLDISATNGTISYYSPTETSYSIIIFSNTGQQIFKGNTSISFSLVTEPPVTIQVSSTVVQLRVPFYPNAQSIAIYHLQNKILNIDLSKEFCNHNSICDLGENSYNCPNDCGAQTQPIPWFYFIIGIVIVIILIAIYFISKKYTIQI